MAWLPTGCRLYYKVLPFVFDYQINRDIVVMLSAGECSIYTVQQYLECNSLTFPI